MTAHDADVAAAYPENAVQRGQQVPGGNSLTVRSRGEMVLGSEQIPGGNPAGQLIHTYNYGATAVGVYESLRRVVTFFPDDTTVIAAPEDNDEYRARAASLGYSGPDATWEMCVDHERCHSQLAHTLGLEASPALWHVAHPEEEWEPALVDYEERVVLLLQQKGWA